MIAPDGWDTVTVRISDNSVTFLLFAVIVKSFSTAILSVPWLCSMKISFPMDATLFSKVTSSMLISHTLALS